MEFYKRIDELGDEKPKPYIIDNDYLLDDWFMRYLQSKKKEKKDITKGKKVHQNKVEFI